MLAEDPLSLTFFNLLPVFPLFWWILSCPLAHNPFVGAVTGGEELFYVGLRTVGLVDRSRTLGVTCKRRSAHIPVGSGNHALR